MKRKFRWLALGAAGVAALSLGIAALPASSQGQPTTTVIEAFEPEGAEKGTDINVGKKGFSPGDYSVFKSKGVDLETGEKVYTLIGHFTFVRSVGKEDGYFHLNATAILADGKVAVAGAGKFSDFETGLTVPVTGGTGAYQNATGEVTVVEGEHEGTPGTFITIHLQLH